MKIKVNDLHQFFKFCQLQNGLITIIEQNHRMLFEDIFKSIKGTKTIISKVIKLKSPLTNFCKKYNLKLIDLDMLQIVLSEKSETITVENYLEKTIFEQKDHSLIPQIIKKLNNSILIKQKYLILENPFGKLNTTKEEKPKKSILKLLNSPLAVKRSKEKFSFEFKIKLYENSNQILEDLLLLDKIIQCEINNTQGLTKVNLTLLYNTQLKKIKESYNNSLKGNKSNFSKFLLEHDLKIEDFLLILKYLNNKFDINPSSLSISNELFDKFKNEKSFDKLMKHNLLKDEGGWIEIAENTLKGLFEISIKNKNNNNITLSENPTESFNQICLHADTKKQILDAISQHKNKDIIFKEWGLEKSLDYGKGITLNLSGPPGTGKTLSAKAIANYLGKQLLTINYSQIESMWVGETEKNIAKAFENAKKNDAVLFFDEADSLTTKRENARASWEITRTNTLLKELEAFDGICIFATNFTENYDEAFNRRLSAHIKFRLPDAEQLKTILQIHFPNTNALHSNVNFEYIAQRSEGSFSGGDIKNVVLNAARIAANDPENDIRKINQGHLIEACELVFNGKRNLISDTPVLSYLG